MEKPDLPTIHDLYPDLTTEQLTEVEDALERYLALVLRIYERIERYPHPGSLTPGTGTLASDHPRPEFSGEVNSPA